MYTVLDQLSIFVLLLTVSPMQERLLGISYL
jgi:hypothetical protein